MLKGLTAMLSCPPISPASPLLHPQHTPLSALIPSPFTTVHLPSFLHPCHPPSSPIPVTHLPLPFPSLSSPHSCHPPRPPSLSPTSLPPPSTSLVTLLPPHSHHPPPSHPIPLTHLPPPFHSPSLPPPQASSKSLLEATNRTLPCTAKARSPVASPPAPISMEAIPGPPTELGTEAAVTCPALATATSIHRAAMARSRAAGSREGLEEDSRHILAPSTALASVAVAETFYLCVLVECVVPCPSSRPFTHTCTHTIFRLWSVLVHVLILYVGI